MALHEGEVFIGDAGRQHSIASLHFRDQRAEECIIDADEPPDSMFGTVVRGSHLEFHIPFRASFAPTRTTTASERGRTK